MRTLVFFAALALASAACPNKCSGHGTCKIGDACSCQPRWLGPDCSLRECSYGLSWVTSSDTDSAPSGTNNNVAFGSISATNAAGVKKNTVSLINLDETASTVDGYYEGMTISFTSGAAYGQSAVIYDYNVDRVATIVGGFVESPSNAGTPNESKEDGSDLGRDGEHTTTVDRSVGGIVNAPEAGDGYVIQLLANQEDQGRHNYAECSAKGTCDRGSGECQCFPGYEGKGCRRQACPNSCSGHGRCVYNNEINPMYSPNAENADQSWCSDGGSAGDQGTGSAMLAKSRCMGRAQSRWHGTAEANEFASQHWDYGMSRQCTCDRGFEGLDCSSRICPQGDDPLNTCDKTAGAGGEVDDIQLLRFAGPQDNGIAQQSSIDHFFTLTFKDMFGGNYTTTPIKLYHENPPLSGAISKAKADITASAIELALEALPNFAVPNVTVTPAEGCLDATKSTKEACTSAKWDDYRQNSYYVTFVDEANSGEQNLLSCNRNANSYDSDQVGKCTSTDTTLTLTAGNYKSRKTCSAFGGVWKGLIVDSVTNGKVQLLAGSADPRNFMAVNDAVYIGKSAHNDLMSTDAKGSGVTLSTYCADGSTDTEAGCSAASGVWGVAVVTTAGTSASDIFVAGDEVYTVSGHYIGTVAAAASTTLIFEKTAETNVGVFAASEELAMPQSKITTSGAYVGRVTHIESDSITLDFDSLGDASYKPRKNDALVVGGHAHNDSAVQPRFATAGATNRGSRAMCSATSERDTLYKSPAYAYKQKAECSNRGACDAGSGTCTCFEGFTGEACATQTVFF